MRGAGLSKQKSAYLKDLAAKTSSGLLDFARLPQLPDVEVVEHLTQVKGIGVWTAQMFLMFSLKRENVLPTGDFGVRMAMHRHYLDVPVSYTHLDVYKRQVYYFVYPHARYRHPIEPELVILAVFLLSEVRSRTAGG